ncbi:MAG: GNAT family N-acetyltransferase [Acidimicrobiales bacterium]|nr:GNAT family N-acetyltransferase [Acidimicrobiales bacterium]
MAVPGPAEVELATLHVAPTAHGDALVVAVVEAAAADLGLTVEAGANLAQVAGAVARAICRGGFDDPADAALDVRVARLGRQALVHLDDRGLPFNAQVEDALDGAAVAAALAGGWLDSFVHRSLGRDGNRTTLVRHGDPGVDHRQGVEPAGSDAAEPPEQASADAIGADVAIEVRQAGPADAEAICRLTWRTYGYTYQHDEYYRPDLLASMLASGHQASFVSVTPDGEVVGHSAVLIEHEGDVLVEGGRAMVDPRFRGHHLMHAGHERLEQWMRDHGVLALEGAAVTAHTRSQADRPVASVQLGFLPPIRFRAIDGSEQAHREAVVGGVVPVAPIPHQTVHAPERDAAMVGEIYRRIELDRTVGASGGPPGPGSASQMDLTVRADLGHAVMTCADPGADLAGAVRQRLALIARSGIGVSYADLPLDRPTASWAADVLAGEGFVFAGVLPLAHRGVDVVRYQRLGDTPVDPTEIHLRHPFAEQLLEYVLDQLRRVGASI